MIGPPYRRMALREVFPEASLPELKGFIRKVRGIAVVLHEHDVSCVERSENVVRHVHSGGMSWGMMFGVPLFRTYEEGAEHFAYVACAADGRFTWDVCDVCHRNRLGVSMESRRVGVLTCPAGDGFGSVFPRVTVSSQKCPYYAEHVVAWGDDDQ